MAITQTTPRASLSSHTSTNVARAHALPSRIPSRSFSHAHTQPHTPILSHTLSPATVSRSGGSNPSPGAHSHPRPRHSPSSGPSGLLGGSAQWAAQPPCAPRFTDAAASSAGNAPRASSARFLGGRARAAGGPPGPGAGSKGPALCARLPADAPQPQGASQQAPRPFPEASAPDPTSGGHAASVSVMRSRVGPSRAGVRSPLTRRVAGAHLSLGPGRGAERKWPWVALGATFPGGLGGALRLSRDASVFVVFGWTVSSVR